MAEPAKKPRKRPTRKTAATARKSRTVKTRAKPTCMVVLGMHRSGTSAVTGTLTLLGCDAPKTLMPASESNEKGHIESMRINDFLIKLLKSAASRWDDWLAIPDAWFDSARADELQIQAVELFAEEYGTSRLMAFKNPRVCRLLPFWDRVWDEAGVEPKFVMIHRDPVEVAASLERRNGIDPQLGMLIWLRHVLDAEAGTRGRPRSFVTYANLLQNWRQTAEKLQSDLDTSFPRFSLGVTDEVEDFLSPSLRHFNGTSDTALNNSAVPDWVHNAYAILERWATDGEDAKDYQELDSIRQAFDTAAPSFARIVQRGRDLAQTTQAASEELEQRRLRERELQDTLSQIETQYESLKSQKETEQLEAEDRNASLQSSIAALEARAETAERDAKQFKFEAEQAKQHSEEVRQEKLHTVAEREALKEDLKRLEEERAEAESLRAEIDVLRAAHATEIENLAADLKTAKETLDESTAEREDLHESLKRRETEIELVTQNLSGLESSLTKVTQDAVAKEDEYWAKEEEFQHEIKNLNAELTQTQSALRQRTHEAEETANRVLQLSEEVTGYEVEISKLTGEVLVQKDSVESLRKELSALRKKGDEDQQSRFKEIAALTENLIFHENNLNALNADLRTQLTEQSAALAAHQEKLRALTPKLENATRLADRAGDALRSILETDTVVKGRFKRLANRRKARLIEALGLFDREWYLARNPDVSEAKLDPALHFVQHGYREGRSATPEIEKQKRIRS